MPIKDEDNPMMGGKGFDPKNRDQKQVNLPSRSIFCAKSKKTPADGAKLSQHAMQVVDDDGTILFGGLIFLSEEWSRYYADHEHEVKLRVRPMQLNQEYFNPREFYEHMQELFKDFQFKPAEYSLRPTGREVHAPGVAETRAKGGVTAVKKDKKITSKNNAPSIPGIGNVPSDTVDVQEDVKVSTFTKKMKETTDE